MAKEEKEIKSSNAYKRRSKNKRKVAIIASVSAAVVAAGAGTGLYFITKINKEKKELEQQQAQVYIKEIKLTSSFKDTYFVGGALNLEGGKITVYKSNGTTEVVDVTKDMVTGFDSTTTGNKQLTITYQGSSCYPSYVVSNGKITSATLQANIRQIYHDRETSLEILGTPSSNIVKIYYEDLEEPFIAQLDPSWIVPKGGFVKDALGNVAVQTGIFSYSINVPDERTDGAVDGYTIEDASNATELKYTFEIRKAYVASVKATADPGYVYRSNNTEFNYEKINLEISYKAGSDGPVCGAKETYKMSEALSKITVLPEFDNVVGINKTASFTYDGVPAEFIYAVLEAPVLIVDGINGETLVETANGEKVALDDVKAGEEIILPAHNDTIVTQDGKTKYFVGYAEKDSDGNLPETPQYLPLATTYTIEPKDGGRTLFPIYMEATIDAFDESASTADTITLKYNGADLTSTEGILVVPHEYNGKSVTAITTIMYDETTKLSTKHDQLKLAVTTLETEVTTLTAAINTYEALESPTQDDTDTYNENIARLPVATNELVLARETYANFVSDYSSVETVVIPYGVTEIGAEAFAYCSGLKSVVILSKEDTVIQPMACVQVMNSMVNIKEEMPLAQVPEVKMETIGINAFKGCSELENINIPSTVTMIDNGAFANTASLKSVVVEVDETTGKSSIELVGAYAFANSGVEVLDFSNTVMTKLGSKSFEGCKTIKTVFVPDTLQYIGQFAFSGATSLISVGTKDALVTSEGIKEEVILPESMLGEIGDGKSGYEENSTIAAQLSGTFAGSNVKKVTIPTGITKLGYGTFMGTANLEEIVFAKNAAGYTTIKTMNEYRTFKGSGIKSFAFPDEIKEGQTVLQPGINFGSNECFQDCKRLESVYFGLGTHYQPSWAPNSYGAVLPSTSFKGCSSLKTISYNDSLQLKEIGAQMFQDCTSLTAFGSKSQIEAMTTEASRKIIIPSTVTKIQNQAFSNTAIKNLEFAANSNLTEIGLEAFNGCVNLTGVVIPNKVTKFGDSVFKGCSKLASVTLPTNNNFKVISPWMFAGCKKLEYINIPNTVTSINKFAFSESGLRAVVIPESVSILEKRAFWLIENLARVEINSKELVSGGEVFQAEYKDEVSEYTGLNKNLEIIEFGPTVERVNFRDNDFTRCQKHITITMRRNSGAAGNNFTKFVNCDVTYDNSIPEHITGYSNWADAGVTEPSQIEYDSDAIVLLGLTTTGTSASNPNVSGALRFYISNDNLDPTTSQNVYMQMFDTILEVKHQEYLNSGKTEDQWLKLKADNYGYEVVAL